MEIDRGTRAGIRMMSSGLNSLAKRDWLQEVVCAIELLMTGRGACPLFARCTWMEGHN
jgi:hypothetical protein